jgi:hypothetical protein
MKVLKKTYNKNPIKDGEWIAIRSWSTKDAYGKPGVIEQWIDAYDKVAI